MLLFDNLFYHGVSIVDALVSLERDIHEVSHAFQQSWNVSELRTRRSVLIDAICPSVIHEEYRGFGVGGRRNTRFAGYVYLPMLDSGLKERERGKSLIFK